VHRKFFVDPGRRGLGLGREFVRQIGIVLTEHFPPRADDTNELPDRLIQL